MNNKENRYFYKIEKIEDNFNKWFSKIRLENEIIKIVCRINDEDIPKIESIFNGIKVSKRKRKNFKNYNFIQLEYDNSNCKDNIMNTFIIISNKNNVNEILNKLKEKFEKIEFKKNTKYSYSITLNNKQDMNKYSWVSNPKENIPQPKYPIGILSYGRYNLYGRTHILLTKMKVNHYLFVEPCEYDKYKDFYNPEYCELIKCPEDFHLREMGSTPVRNYMIEYFKDKGYDKLWMLDDNIREYRRFHQGKKINILSPVIFTSIENYVDNYDNVGLAGHNFNSFLVENTQLATIYKNTKIYSSFLIRTDIDIRFNHRHQEDNFISIDYIEKGYCNLCFNHILYSKYSSGYDKGGNTIHIYKRENNFIGYKERYEYFYKTLKKMIENKEITLKKDNQTIEDFFNRVNLKSKEYHAKVNYRMLKGYNENDIYLKPEEKRKEQINYDKYLIKEKCGTLRKKFI